MVVDSQVMLFNWLLLPQRATKLRNIDRSINIYIYMDINIYMYMNIYIDICTNIYIDMNIEN